MLVLAASVVTLAACGPDGDDAIFARPSQDGNLRLLLTDAPFPFDLVASADVTVDRVELVGDETVVLFDEPQAFNLLDLRHGVTALLAEVEVPEGRYGQIRLLVAEGATVTLVDDRVFDLKMPSGAESGIKIPTGGLEVEDGTLTSVTLDFDAARSFVVQGSIDTPAGIRGFLFRPVVHLEEIEIDDRDTEEIFGLVDEVGTDYVIVEGVRYDVTAETELDGLQALSDLMPGDYVELDYVEADGGALVAIEIERKGDDDDEHEDDEREVKGALDEVGADYVVVETVRFEVDAETEFDGFASLDALRAGDFVEVEYVDVEAGVRLALEIERDDD